MKTKIKGPIQIFAILCAFTVISSCLLSIVLFSPSCELDQQIHSQFLVHPEIPNVKAIIDFAYSPCFEGTTFLGQKEMQKLIDKVRWDAHFCIGETAVRTWFMEDAYGCGEHGGLIVVGPALQVFVRNDSK
jgi:hypothetical protein